MSVTLLLMTDINGLLSTTKHSQVNASRPGVMEEGERCVCARACSRGVYILNLNTKGSLPSELSMPVAMFIYGS